MPIKIPDTLPARAVLEKEHIFVMTHRRALHQDIRPLRIALVNLMPTKITTETQILRCLANTPLQIEVDLIQTVTHKSKNTPEDHLLNFYETFDDIKNRVYDGCIITGAPVELMDYEQVDYWPELCRIFEWTKTNVHSTFHICWAAQAGLYYHYGVPKYILPQKVFGVFPHHALKKNPGCSAVLTMFTGYRIPARPRYALKISKRFRSFGLCLFLRRSVYTLSAIRKAASTS